MLIVAHSTEKDQPLPLENYSGKVVLIVNTASKCGFTPQYEGLEKLYKKLKTDHGDDFEILGFPCNQFGRQEPGSADEIENFCQVNYGVSFKIVSEHLLLAHIFYHLCSRFAKLLEVIGFAVQEPDFGSDDERLIPTFL